MVTVILAQYIGAAPKQVERLLALSEHQIYQDATYHKWVNQVDPSYLQATLGYARQAYDRYYAHFEQVLRNHYNSRNTAVLSAFTPDDSLLDYFYQPEARPHLAAIRQSLPREALMALLPDILAILDDMPVGRADWQRALALMALPLVAV